MNRIFTRHPLITLLIIIALVAGIGFALWRSVPSISARLGSKNTEEKTTKDDLIPIVRVNDALITNHDLLVRQRIHFLETNAPETAQTLKDSHDDILKELIKETLQNQYADQLSVSNYEDEANKQLERVAQQNQKTMPQMMEILEKKNITKNDMLRYISTAIRWQSVLYGTINQTMSLPPTDINARAQSKKALIGQTVYQALELDIKNPNDKLLADITNALQKNPNGWQGDLGPLLQSRQLTIVQRPDMLVDQFGPSLAPQLKAQKADLPPGTALGPVKSADNSTAKFYVLLRTETLKASNMTELREAAANELKGRAMQPLDTQLRDKIWREAIIEKL